VNVYDPYMFGANAFDLVVDVEAAFEKIAAMTWCHQSQIREWIPWVGRHDMQAASSIEEWSKILRRRFANTNRGLGIGSENAFEVFRITAWGEVPELKQIMDDFPGISRFSNLEQLEERLATW